MWDWGQIQFLIRFARYNKQYLYLLKACELQRLTRNNKFSAKLNTSRDWPVKGTETRQICTHKETILLQKNHGKERLEDYSTSIA